MKRRNWGDVWAEIDGEEIDVLLYSPSRMSLRAADDLIENLKSATAWIRDQQRREKEEETPELPL
jgi:hypothetical protein